MPLAEVAFYDVVKWLHIAAFFVAFGPTYGYGMFMAAASKVGPTAIVENARVMMMWSRIAITTGAILLLITGHYMVNERFDFSDFFVNWGNVVVLLVLGLTHAYFIPRDKRVIGLIESGNGEEAMAVGQQAGKVGAVLGLVMILTVYVMTAKPF